MAVGAWFTWSNLQIKNYAGIILGMFLFGAGFVSLQSESLWPYWIVFAAALAFRLAGYNPYWGNKDGNDPTERESLPMSTHDSESRPTQTIADDRVCGVTVDPETAEWRFTYKEREYLFCSKDCLDKFSADPDGYLSGSVQKAEAMARAGRKYVCPANPEVEQLEPGDCPKCGTPLKSVEIDSEPS